ncbi:MAG: HEAT repeat domain-containing protein, partial [Planktothrix sp.]
MKEKQIDELIDILETTADEDTRRRAAYSLGKIAQDKQAIFYCFFNFPEISTDEVTRRQEADYLGQIAQDKETAISALVNLLETTTDESTRRQVAESLGQIGKGNKTAISALINLRESTTDESTRRQAARSLGQIGKGNETAISALVNLLETTTDESTRRQAARSLGQIGTGNKTAISALVKLLETTTDKFSRIRLAESLGQISPGNETAIVVLIEVWENTSSEKVRRLVINSLSEITTQKNIPDDIWEMGIIVGCCADIGDADLERQYFRNRNDSIDDTKSENIINNILNTQNEFIKWKMVESISKIKLNQFKATKTLITILNNTGNEFIQWQCIKNLQQIWKNSQITEEFLSEIRQYWQSTNNLFLLWQISEYWQNFKIPLESSYQSNPNFYIYYNKIIDCIDVMQEGRDLFSRRLLINSCLEVHHRIVQFCIQSANFSLTFFYTEIFRNRYLVERLAQQDAPLPATISKQLAQDIHPAKQRECQTLQAYTDGMNQHLPEVELAALSLNWENAKETLENLYRKVAEIEPEFIAKTKVYPISFEEVKELLPSDTAIIEFFFTENELITLLILPGHESPLIPEELRVNLKPQNPFERLARDWVADLADKSKSKND